MTFGTDTAIEDAMAQAWAAIGSPGSFFTAAERVAFAEHARAARGLATATTSLPPDVATTVARVAAQAMTTREHHVQEWVQNGRDVHAYIELVAVVAQVAGMDSYRFGLGAPLDPLPAPTAGDPVPVVHPDAKRMNAWVPTVGVALAPTAISALPNESATKKAVASAWYIPDTVVHQYDVEPGLELSRPQMEVIAARTSWLNECFF